MDINIKSNNILIDKTGHIKLSDITLKTYLNMQNNKIYFSSCLSYLEKGKYYKKEEWRCLGLFISELLKVNDINENNINYDIFLGLKI